MTVLHNFFAYLPTSQNWAYNLIKHTPVERVLVYASIYRKTNFYLDGVTYLNDGLPGVNDAMRRYVSGKTLRERLLYAALSAVEKLLLAHHQSVYLQALKQHEVNVIHSHFATVAIGKKNLINRSGCKHVVSFYGYDYEMAPKADPTIMSAYRQLFAEADAFVCEGNNGARILADYGCPKSKIHVVKLGIEPGKITPLTRQKEAGQLRLIQIANYTEKKGHIYTLRAFAKALPRCPGLRLTLVGSAKRPEDQAVAEEVFQTVKDLQLGNAVELVSSIDYARLSTYLQDFDVFIHPSCYARNYDCEGGAPVVILDAQAAGLPVISTHHCDIPDEVVDKVTGLLSAEKDTESLAESIVEFYNMPTETYQRFSAAAIEHVRSEYNVANSGKKLAALYSSLLSK
ncbi:glycosyltransferase family 4 protein [Neolewinella litorea]|uniref:Glycosyltransferase n=1 Tax=Neolewinella litorea TaxID=2562452 RepID=A0A4S4NAK1_9BACT|nr:glycosyltransferase family 4 protein [Neolewinella litorea]THH36364.1 glycosyltransferase [Neolewinella litorea]